MCVGDDSLANLHFLLNTRSSCAGRVESTLRRLRIASHRHHVLHCTPLGCNDLLTEQWPGISTVASRSTQAVSYIVRL